MEEEITLDKTYVNKLSEDTRRGRSGNHFNRLEETESLSAWYWSEAIHTVKPRRASGTVGSNTLECGAQGWKQRG